MEVNAMAYYLKGIGDRAGGVNEILPQFDARIMYFLKNCSK
jgi:hypothetical protein